MAPIIDCVWHCGRPSFQVLLISSPALPFYLLLHSGIALQDILFHELNCS